MTSPGGLVAQAGAWAAQLHRDQRRKVSGAPYFAHLLGAAGAVASVTSDPVVIAAAFLHDAIEDQGATLADARIALMDSRADDVWRIVRACTDTAPRSGDDSWRARKGWFLDRLDALLADPDVAFVRSVLAVALADKLYNARSIEHELRAEGAKAFERMTGRTDAVEWYLPQLAGRLTALAAHIGDPALSALASDYAETVERIGHIYEMLPGLERERAAGRAADIAMGINEIEIPERNGTSVVVSVRLTPLQTLATSGHPVVGESRASGEATFVNAITGALDWVCTQAYDPQRPAQSRLGHAFSVGAIALEHGGGTAETCAAILLPLTSDGDQRVLTTEVVSEHVGLDVGPETAAILAGCRRFTPGSGQGLPMLGLHQVFLGGRQANSVQPAVYRVIAADEVPRALALEDAVKRAALPLADGPVKHRIAELETLSQVLARRLGGSLSLVLDDALARIRTYLDVSLELMEEAARREPGTRRDDFALTGSDGRQYWVEVTQAAPARVRPEPTDIGFDR